MPTRGLKANSAFRTLTPSSEGCVVSYCPTASSIGTRVLGDGGNAVDAACAVALALSITYPQAGGIGGGGFMMIKKPGEEGEFLDYRESAPAGVKPEMFLGEDGNLTKATVTGPLSVAVPGCIAGMAAALEKYGSWAWDRVVETVIPLAVHGVWITNRQSRYVNIYADQLREYESTAKAFFQFSAQRPGSLFRQPDLGRTLSILAHNGPEDFYKGRTARRIIRSMEEHGGVMTADDLANYKPIWRKPLSRNFYGKKVLSAGLPSGGGIVLLSSLGLMEASGIHDTKDRSVERYELLARCFRAAFRKRSTFAGDPAFISAEDRAAAELAATSIYSANALSDYEIAEGLRDPFPTEGPMPPRNTTHFAVIDADGLGVSNTYSLNTLFGSKFVSDKTGVIMNNTIDDFGVAPGIANWYDLYEGENNLLRPGARPIGSMAPTIVLDENDHCEILVGGSGGPRIPTAVAQVLVGMLVSKLSLKLAMQAPRVHHQNLPRDIHIEDGVGWEMGEQLEKLGHTVSVFPRLGITAGIHDLAGKGVTASLDMRF